MTKARGPREVESTACPRRSEDRRRSESGSTLVEVLLAVLILGITSAAILLAFSSSIFASAAHRNLITADIVLRDVSESATSQIQQSTSAFVCPATGTNVSFTAASGYALPAGYTAAVSVTYWNGAAFTSTCIPNASQLVLIQVTANGTTSSISSVVDDPLAPAAPASGTSAGQLVFHWQPGNQVSGVALSPRPVVYVEDAGGNLVTNDLSPVNLLITQGSGTNGATLSNSCSGSEFFGVVTFSNCSINTAGKNYSLTASITTVTATGSSTLISASSGTFNVSPAAASQLVFSTSPSSTTAAGTPFAQQPVVTVADAFGNTVPTDSSTVTLAITSGTGTSGAVLSNCAGTEIAGIVSFAGCNVTTAGTGYTLTAADGAVASAVSNGFTISAGAGSQLVFTTSPSITNPAGSPFATQPVVTVVDAFANTVTTDASTVTLSITAGSGTAGAVVSSGCSGSESAGVVTFTGCSVAKAGTNYTLTASDSPSRARRQQRLQRHTPCGHIFRGGQSWGANCR